MSLPALQNSGADSRVVAERLNRLIREFNRTDLSVPVYAADTGSATAYAIAPAPGIAAYAIGQIFVFKAANANSGTAPTLNVNSKGAGTIYLPTGGALVAGDIPANGMAMVVVASTTPTFHLLNPVLSPVPATPPATNTGATTFLGSDVALNNTATFFSGPNTGSIGANGQVWLILAVAAVRDTAGAAGIVAQIHDGTNPIVADTITTGGTSYEGVISLHIAVTLTGATTFTLKACDITSTNGQLLTTSASAGVSNKSTYITAVRLS